MHLVAVFWLFVIFWVFLPFSKADFINFTIKKKKGNDRVCTIDFEINQCVIVMSF